MRLDLGSGGPVSSTGNPESDGLPPPDFPCKTETHPDSIWAKKELRGMLGAASKTLPERSQKVVQLYYTKNFTMKEIALEIGCNENRVSQIHKAALAKMATALRSHGISSIHAF
jgi:RNA polymerase sigma factor (sigma-70 family)